MNTSSEPIYLYITLVSLVMEFAKQANFSTMEKSAHTYQFQESWEFLAIKNTLLWCCRLGKISSLFDSGTQCEMCLCLKSQ